jgi:enoyl-CoA hydratase
LVTRAVAAADVLPSARAMAERRAALAPQAVHGTKMAINRLLSTACGAVLPLSLAPEAAAVEHDDFHAAMAKLSRR